MRRIVTCVIFILVSVMALAQQDAIKGCVKDSDGNPVPGAIIKATSSSTILGYTTSDDKGGYSLSVERKGDVVVSVDCLGYESSSVILHKDTSGTCDFSLKEKRIGLKEAVVRAPAIRQLGDTLSYADGTVENSNKISLISGQPLKSAERETLEKWLHSRYGEDFIIEFSTAQK